MFELEVEKPLKVGDKISGRHGNKGVISRILPDEKMPKVLIDGEWTTADVLLSPLSVVSRMNLGQLFETQISLLIKKGLYRDCFDVTETVDEPQRREILEKLKSLGADDLGRFPVRFDDTEIRAVAGYQYMVRLDHCVGDKIHAIGLHAPTSPITFQPFKGRSRNGGQRLGEMEFWTLLDHNAFKTLELFKECNRDSTEDRVTEKLNEFLSHILSRVYGVRYSVNNSQVVFEKGKIHRQGRTHRRTEDVRRRTVPREKSERKNEKDHLQERRIREERHGRKETIQLGEVRHRSVSRTRTGQGTPARGVRNGLLRKAIRNGGATQRAREVQIRPREQTAVSAQAQHTGLQIRVLGRVGHRFPHTRVQRLQC
ncbi:hypothetical protein [Thermotoga sp. Ku-13t]|uniref:hypothetical protein n=1 Tax=Thermotoga sp. Ku-13t TaxID=1755813 RepID=UPI0013E9F85A|nr:hypothetical protein [Thermotoga sp. Ku-13t]